MAVTPAFHKILPLKKATTGVCDLLMTADRKTSATIPVIIAAICLAIILILVVFSLAGRGRWHRSSGPLPPCTCPAVTPSVPCMSRRPFPPLSCCHPDRQFQDRLRRNPLHPPTFVLTRPPAADRIPYTARGFLAICRSLHCVVDVPRVYGQHLGIPGDTSGKQQR